MPTQTGSYDLKAAKAAAEIAEETKQYFWFNSTDSGAGEGAGAHVTQVDQETFVSDPDNGGGNVLIDNDSVEIRDGKKVLASFGEETVIGDASSQHLRINDSGIKGINDAGEVIFDVDSKGSSNTLVVLDEHLYVSGSDTLNNGSKTVEKTFKVPDVVDPYLDDISLVFYNNNGLGVTSYRQNYNNGIYVSGNPYYGGSTFRVSLRIPNKLNSFVDGNISFNVYMKNDTVSAGLSLSIHHNKQNKTIKISITVSQSVYSGFRYQVSLNAKIRHDVVMLSPSYTLGVRCDTSGDFSAIIGLLLTAKSHGQLAIGKCNNNKSDDAFEIGNGVDDDNRSNAFTVDWDGNFECAINTSATSGTTDYALYSAITALSWESEVID